jgi:N-acetylglutamate synthase-like GNAT family acetyltransferase
VITHNNQLSITQLMHLDTLSAECERIDGGLPVSYRHLLMQQRHTDSNWMVYHHQELIGFASIYFFYEACCEVCLLVHPAHRRQGIAKQLLHLIDTSLKQHPHIKRLIFSTPPLTETNWLTQLGFLYQESEYEMTRTSLDPIQSKTDRLTLSNASISEVNELAHIDERCFPQSIHNPPSQFVRWLSDPNYQIIVAHLQNKIIGKVHIRTLNEQIAILSDISIIPEFQQQGLGSELLTKIINQTLQQKKTTLKLDVATNNPSNALQLYLHHGFKISYQHDYWAISLDLLQSNFFSN